ncbi:MAG: DUF167 domain-containing protein [Parcubacteria group bacterium]|nr:DUF167 domain-containing protein [Parcubacteria group bacterium]
MKFYIKAKPNKKSEKIEKIDENHWVVFVKEPPVENKANQALIKLIADDLGVALSRIKIISGLKSKNKIIQIDQ